MAFFHHAGTVSALAASDLDIGTILTVDSVNTRVGVGTASPAVTLEVHNTTTSSAHTGGQIRLSANDGAPMGDSHRLGAIEFSGAEDSSGTQVVGARIEALTDAAWTNVENGCALYFYTTDGNASQTNVLKLDSNQKATFSGLIQGTTATLSGLATFNGNATVLSGSASALSKVTLGTDTAKTTIGCPGGTDTFFTGTAAGDLVLRADDNNNKVHVGAGTSGKAAMVVTEVANVGKVGVGTASPGAQLDIQDTTTSSANTGGHLRLSANDGAAMGDSHRLGVIEFTGAEDTGGSQTVGARIESMTDAAWSASENGAALYFFTTDGNASQSQVLKLDSNKKATFAGSVTIAGNVGIGNTSPAQALHIGDSSATVLQAIRLQNDQGNSDIGVARGGGDLEQYSAAGDLVITNHTADIILGAGSVGRVLIDSAGNVGIGLASIGDPPGTLLQLENTAPYLTFKNTTAENTAGGCESKIIFEDHANVTLGQIEGSHSGTSDDTKGKLILSTHTGSALTAALTIDETQNVTIAGTAAFRNNHTTTGTFSGDIDLSSTTASLNYYVTDAMADAEDIKLPTPSAALAGMVIRIIFTSSTATSISTGIKVGMAHGASAALEGVITLNGPGASSDTLAMVSSSGIHSLQLDSDSLTNAGGAAGSIYEFHYHGISGLVFVRGWGITTNTGTCALATLTGSPGVTEAVAAAGVS